MPSDHERLLDSPLEVAAPNTGAPPYLLLVFQRVFEVGMEQNARYVGEVHLPQTGVVLHQTGPLPREQAEAECREWMEHNVVRWTVREGPEMPLKRGMGWPYWRRTLAAMLRENLFPHDGASVERMIALLREVAKLGKMPS